MMESNLAKIMRDSSIHSLLFTVLLGLYGSCQKRTNQVTPVQAPSCLIATQTTKELVSPQNPSLMDLETVTIGKELFRVSTTKKSVYTYDKQGRILTEYNLYPGNKSDSVLYQYMPVSVTIRTIDNTATTKPSVAQVVTLNEQGFSEKQPTTSRATYAKDGYLLVLKDEYGEIAAKIDNGNVLEFIWGGRDATPTYTNKNEYDLSKPSLPSIQSFYGKASRNLLIKTVIQQNGPFGIFPNVYIVDYTHTFDSKGRVECQMQRGKDGEPRFIYGGDIVGVKDFTYFCP